MPNETLDALDAKLGEAVALMKEYATEINGVAASFILNVLHQVRNERRTAKGWPTVERAREMEYPRPYSVERLTTTEGNNG